MLDFACVLRLYLQRCVLHAYKTKPEPLEVFMTVFSKTAVVRDMVSYSMVDLPDYTTSNF